jgi:endonuclease-3
MANIDRVIYSLKKATKAYTLPIVSAVALDRKNPYLILISCILSLRTRDKTAAEASTRLFLLASGPAAMLLLGRARIQKLIYPVGFYRTKAKAIVAMSRQIIEEHAGKVPRTIEGLLALPGVGRKTANLVLGLGYNIPAICVDTHVHRISNILGWVKTRTPEQTEYALQRLLPKKHWIEINELLVIYGQNLCQPVSPWCSRCVIRRDCARIGVVKSR